MKYGRSGVYELRFEKMAYVRRKGSGCGLSPPGHRQKLFDAMRRDYAHPVFTVNASPCAVEVYRHLGFVPTDEEQSADGLRFTPMQYSAQAEEDTK